MSQLPVPSTWSLSQQTLALRMAKKHKEKEAKMSMSTSLKGVAHRVHQKLHDKSACSSKESRNSKVVIVESISIPKLVHHNLSHHFYIAIITYILVQYCGHYFSESNCKPDQKETCCERESVPIQTNEGCSCDIILVLGLING